MNGDQARPLLAFIGGAMPDPTERSKLAGAERRWSELVGTALAARSAPVDVAGGELLVAASSAGAAKRLEMMSGSLARALRERLGLGVDRVRIAVGKLPLKAAPPPPAWPRRRSSIAVPESEVEELARQRLKEFPDLPKDAAEAISRLELFLSRRRSSW
ncbi:MAG: DUF721 domain-containing protein [Synergistaceae bacterium]|jgi:hypothetical protein|nr:DUF721 domain-containing protein [Synergistaceae bacterium]